MNTFTLTYRDGGRLVNRVIEARDRREAEIRLSAPLIVREST